MGDSTDIETWGMTMRPSHVILASTAGSVHNVSFRQTCVLQRDFTFNNLELFEALDNPRSHSVDSFEAACWDQPLTPPPPHVCLPETPGLLSPLKVIKIVHRWWFVMDLSYKCISDSHTPDRRHWTPSSRGVCDEHPRVFEAEVKTYPAFDDCSFKYSGMQGLEREVKRNGE